MSKRKVKITIICEDSQQECFARRFLYAMGWNKRQLRIIKSPGAKGSGEQWVRENYTKELKHYRTGHVSYRLITIVDGDKQGVSGRKGQFDRKCKQENVTLRKDHESVAIIVPTMNIETWISYLEGNEVDESTIYPKLRFESECMPAVEKLVSYCKSDVLPADTPASLQDACVEFRQRIRG